MGTSRTTQFAKVHRILKKHYKPAAPDPERPVLEQVLLGCCLEDAHYEVAEEAFAALVHTFFDFNEIRVTTIAELSEVMCGLPDSRAAANRLKRALQSIFEATYAFDLEELRKKNLGPTVKWLRKLDGTTNFTVSYVVQSALGGHAIPVDGGTLRTLRVVDLVSNADVEAEVVPGLERAIAKAKGIEFGSLLHRLGADFTANPYSPALHKILLEIDPDAKDRLPKRRAARRGSEGPAGEQAEADATGADEKAKLKRKKKQMSTDKPAAGKNVPAEKSSKAAKKKTAEAKKKRHSSRDETVRSEDEPHAKSASSGLSQRKPR